MDDNLTTLLIVIAGILGVLGLRYLKLRMRTAGQMSAGDLAALERMGQAAQLLESRVAVLEHILDAEVPAWRSRPENFYRRAG